MNSISKNNATAKRIHLKLREAILNGYYQPGERLVERELAEIFRVSRTPVRKALEYLEQERLVVRIPNKGATVAKYTPKQVEEIYELRSALEGLAAYLTARKADSKVKSTLVKLVESGRKTLERGDYEKASEYNEQFHSLLASASGNKLLEQTLKTMRWQLSTLLLFTWTSLGRRQKIQEEHEAIVEAVVKGDQASARDRAIEHMNNAGKVALKVMLEREKIFRGES